MRSFYTEHENGNNSLAIWIAGFVFMLLGSVYLYHPVSNIGIALAQFTQIQAFEWIAGYPAGVYSWSGGMVIRLFYEWGLLTLFMFAGIWIAQKIIRGRPLMKITTGALSFRGKRLWAGVIAFSVIMGLFWVFEIIMAMMQPNDADIFGEVPLMEKMGFQLHPDGIKAFLIGLPFVLIGTTLNAGLQELIFRGYLEQGLTRFMSSRAFIITISAVLFSAWHYSAGNAAYGAFGYYGGMVIFGAAMSMISYNDNGLEAAIGIHAANNILFTSIIDNPDYGWTSVSLIQDTVFPLLGIKTLIEDVIIFGLVVLILSVWTFGLSDRVKT